MMALWQAKQSWLTGHLLSAMTTGQSLSIPRSCIGVSGGGLFCLHLYPSNIYKSLCQFLDSISTAVIILTEGIHSKYQFTPLTWHQVMVTELKTEQVCVTALGGEITPALMAPDLARAVRKAGDWNKKMQIFTQQSLYTKNVGPE